MNRALKTAALATVATLLTGPTDAKGLSGDLAPLNLEPFNDAVNSAIAEDHEQPTFSEDVCGMPIEYIDGIAEGNDSQTVFIVDEQDPEGCGKLAPDY